jgi:hypothetical protein
VLAEAVRHHIKEEEEKILPDAKDLEIDFDELGSRMMERKAELMDRGVPPDAEHKMVAAAAGGKSSSTRGERTVIGKKTTAKERATKESR